MQFSESQINRINVSEFHKFSTQKFQNWKIQKFYTQKIQTFQIFDTQKLLKLQNKRGGEAKSGKIPFDKSRGAPRNVLYL